MVRNTLNKTEFYRILDEISPEIRQDKAESMNISNNVFLERISMEGLEGMYEYSKDPTMYKYLERTQPPKSIRDTEKYLNNLLDQVGKKVMGRTRMMWFVKMIEDETIIGTISILNIDYERQMTDWSFGLGSAYWGQGYSLEMLEVMKKYVFEELCLNRIYGCTRVDNEGVINILLALGAKQEGVARQIYRDNHGRHYDGWTYSILADDYFAKYDDGGDVDDFPSEINTDLIAETISKALGGVNVDPSGDMHSIAQWDSLNHINIIVSLQEKTGARFTPAEISGATSVEAIFQILRSKYQQEK